MHEPDRELDLLARAVPDAAIEVHHEPGPGYVESVYEEALAIELALRQLDFERQKAIAVSYKRRPVARAGWTL